MLPKDEFCDMVEDICVERIDADVESVDQLWVLVCERQRESENVCPWGVKMNVVVVSSQIKG